MDARVLAADGFRRALPILRSTAVPAVANEDRTWFVLLCLQQSDSPMAAAYLEKLNPDQRRAVEHGICEPAPNAAPALLVIAGAGSGKTSTLAHRVVHLAASGVDPRRILLMTFSRRAAVEMTRRGQPVGKKAFRAPPSPRAPPTRAPPLPPRRARTPPPPPA